MINDYQRTIFMIATCMPTRVSDVEHAVGDVLWVVETAATDAKSEQPIFRPPVHSAVNRLIRDSSLLDARDLALIADAAYQRGSDRRRH